LLRIFESGEKYFPDLPQLQIGFLVQSILDCENIEEPLRKAVLKYRTISLLTHICQLQSGNKSPAVPPDIRIQSMLRYLNRCLPKPVSVKQLSSRFHISKNHLNVLFHKETGTTIYQYILKKRLALARQEIQNGLGAEEAAYKTGFNNYSNFYRAYKATFGTAPSDKIDKWHGVSFSD
jgi:AraC-like DNA-binding protein